ncbi:MAG: antibiotic biosynthesis monooxygenase [Smithella sp.]
MFMAMVEFPAIKEGRVAAFLEWFAWSNEELAGLKGFVRRRLLKTPEGGNYVAVIEFESQESFMAMRANPIHDEASRRVEPLLDGHPNPRFFEVVIG